jgi:DNA polymerase kappa
MYDNTKAGLQSVNKEKTEAIIKELSENSSFYINEERKAKNRQKRIEALLVKTRHYEASVKGRPDVFRKLQREVADLEAVIESHRDFEHIYVHMDMDMFFAAVEMKKNPQYASLPLGIGSLGMLSTTNYVARQYGVRSGMPGFIGLRLCPELLIVPTDFPACRVESHKFKEVVRTYDPTAQGLGMDEIMMCLNDYLSLHCMSATTHDERFDAAERIVEECRRRVFEATGLTASAGIAPAMTLAKMASNYKKPNGQSSLRLFSREAVLDFLAPIPVRQVPGIGKSQESILAGLGIHTLGDIYADRHRLYHILTRKSYEFLLRSALGVGGMYDSQEAASEEAGGEEGGSASGGVGGDYDDWWRKSVGHERTFRQLMNRADLHSIAYRNLCDAHKTLVKEGLLASQVVLKLKFRSFQVKQHSKTLNVYTDCLEVLQRALDEVLIPVLDQFAHFRLLGVRLEKLKQRADAEGAEGATSVPTAPRQEENRYKTLRDFFKQQQQVNVERRRTAAAPQKGRCKRNRDSEVEEVGSDVEVLVLSSESLLADVDDVTNVVGATPENEKKREPQRTNLLSTSQRRTALPETNTSVVDLDEDSGEKEDAPAIGKSTTNDDDVVLVE